ncbi:general transcription factor 3C polypeptide 2-like isoform X2 [Cimex lectularius]|nr:general transcription factor 3C polypeptide 2-like isoform X2 [Cimex lectularius]
MSDFYQVSSTCSGPGNIQIWSFGDLANTKQTSFVGTRLEYLICHDFGGAWALEWCPVGCQNDKRMGLLAVASASGSIPLFSVPQPKASSEIRFPACKPQPVLILELGPYEKYQCTRISWSKVKPHRTIAGGFVNGYIALWDLLSTSSLLRRGKILYPFKVFQAHYSIITGLMFSPMSDTHLVSCAHDKFLKYWDLKDTTAPQSKNWRNLSTDVTWLQHWMTCATAVDNIYSAGESTMIFNSIRDFVYEPQSFIANVDSSALSISGNDWLNAVALSYDNGQINLAFGRRQPLVSHDDRKKYIKVVMEPHLYNFEVKGYEKQTNIGKEGKECALVDCVSYEEAVGKYGIHFKTDFKMGYREELKGNAPNHIHIYPLIAANKVCWNPNINGFLNLAIGYQSGFVIVPRLIFAPQDQEKIDDVLS